MSKRKQRVQRQKTKRGQPAHPDEVYQFGPLVFARYGRFIHMQNVSTPEEHADAMRRFQETHPHTKTDLEKDVLALQALVARYDPVEIMHRAVYMLLPLFIKYRSENEFSGEESYRLPIVEYLQYLIARTPPPEQPNELTEEAWGGLWSAAKAAFSITNWYMFTREADPDKPVSEIDSLRHDLDMRRLMVRVRRYPHYFAEHLMTALEPYENELQEVYSVSSQELVEELLKVREYQRRGVIARYEQLRERVLDMQMSLHEAGYSIDPHAPVEEIERTQAAIASDDFKELREAASEASRLAFTSAIFDITSLTTLPTPLLSLLSVRPGEEVLTQLTGANHEDLSPLSPSPLHHKPFLEVDGHFYLTYHSGLEDRVDGLIEKDLFARFPDRRTEMEQRRSDRAEQQAFDLLCKTLSPDFAHQNVYYPNPDDAGNLTELDALISVDDVLILLEVKAGGFSDAASRGAQKSLQKDVFELLVEASHQAERAERYIRSNDDAPFSDNTGTQEVVRVSAADYRLIFRVIVTREDLGWIGARLAVLSQLYPDMNPSYPWHISMDDLRIVADLFPHDELRFAHYLEQRLAAAHKTELNQLDEIEHIGLYNSMNYYHEFSKQGVTHVRFDASYMRNIDFYFMDLESGISAELPTQDMPEAMRRLLGALRTSRSAERFHAASTILDLGQEGRNDLVLRLLQLDAARKEGRHRSLRMKFSGASCGLSISHFSDNDWEEELKKSAVQMEQCNCGAWIAIQVTGIEPYEIGKIETIRPGRFAQEELSQFREINEQRVATEIAQEKPGRNDKCPCGSGKKFKKCHGAR